MTGYTFNQLFDFTRTTAATFVGSNGLIQTTPASVNLLTFTQEFDNAGWTKDRVTVAANVATAPDGTSTADKVVDTAAGLNTYRIYNSLTLSAVSYTQTFYAKAAEYSWCYIRIGSAVRAWFNLSNGTLGTVEAGLTASITPAGDGWYRIACTIATATAGAGFGLIGLATGNGIESFTPTTGGMGIFVWGAQLELGSTATTYARNNGGLFPPRFDYDPVTLAPRGILIEEQRTNLLTYSDDWSNGVWSKNSLTVSANVTTAPNGTTTADKLVPDAAGSAFFSEQAFNVTAGTTYTGSIFLKAAELSSNIGVIFGTGALWPSGNPLVTVNLATGVVSSSSGALSTSITNVGNGWYRITLTQTASVTGASSLRISPTNGLAGNGINGIFVWGAQSEAGAFATSYIPTVASQVTRTADICNIAAPMFAPWYSQTQGTLLAEFSSFRTTAVSGIVSEINDGTSNNRYAQVHNATSTDRFLTFIGGAAVVTTLDYTAVGVNAVGKWAAAYQAGNYGACLNGAAPLTSTYGSLPPGLSTLALGNASGGSFLNGYIRRITYYPFRASNNQLQALTT